MNIETRLKTMLAARVAAVIRLDSAHNAQRAAECLIDAGFKCVEITMTVPNAIHIIKTLSQNAPADVLIGAGTIMSGADVRAAIDAGAQFVVSPIFEPETIRPCREAGVVAIPAALTPTEIVMGWRAGGHVIKVFPVGQVGGATYIKTIRGPLPDIPLWVSGNAFAKDAAAYFAAGTQLIGLTAELFPAKLIDAGHWSALTTHMRDTLALALSK